MTGADKVICRAATLLLLLTLTAAPARAQFGGGSGGQDMMTQMAPMLEMMKAKMGKRRFAMMMQTMGPMMSRMMENGGGLGGMMGGGGIPGFGGGEVSGMLGSEMMGMIPQLVSMADIGGGRHGGNAGSGRSRSLPVIPGRSAGPNPESRDSQVRKRAM